MRASVIGSRRIRSVVAWDLVKDDEVEAVGIVDSRKGTLERTKRWIDSNKVILPVLDITSREKAERLMKEYDVGVIALPDRRTSYKTVETAIEGKFNIIEMLEECHRRPEPHGGEGLEVPNGMTLEEYGEWLHKKALEMDKAESAIAKVGGIPAKESAKKHPLKYRVTWEWVKRIYG